ncbi:adenylyl-sulfate kinase [Solirubrobacter phytolaccae]|uniref:Adenylyl-sulfate kinase n=1 Tax=Solirubrobacter phytolaccae TaxID=1404360 RepID=A0A9X3N584_9ACTN|nr:adenylyl-sulfate kinase [Solirubrobacter phytolaccae]MDA0179879.1 adenylyl-sulfate kinase [Solirubrobacter phytolaccae]
MSGDLLRIATAGSVDDGKSTLIGRLLLDSKSLLDDHGEEDLAHVTDGLRAEREQGITIDVAYRFFATERRSFILADTPGHVRYTRNMVTGASTADLALVLVDARKGLLEQSRRHAYLAALLGIRHLVACVNKMDLVDFDEPGFRAIETAFDELGASLGIEDVQAVPISALLGDNVVDTSEHTGWYDGPPLLELLESVEVARDRDLEGMRFPVQWTVRGEDYRGYAGRVAGGVLRTGDEVVVLPHGSRSRIARIDTPAGTVDEAVPPMVATVVLEDELDVGRGDLIATPGATPEVARELEATVCWMVEAPARVGARYLLKHTTKRVRADIADIAARVDIDTFEAQPADELGLNDIGRITLRTAAPVFGDAYAANRTTGAFILIDERTHDTAAAGMIEAARPGRAPELQRSPDIRWHPSALDRSKRWSSLDQRGATVWLTGLPASGKSSIAVAVEEALVEAGRFAYLLDGDNLRHGLSGDLGFDPASRSENIRRVAHVARLFADAGAVALVSLVSPFRDSRDDARRLHEAAGLDFIEVFVDTPLEECARRDPKGLYAKARAGRLPGLTGESAPYEPPEHAELVIRDLSVEEAARRVVAKLKPQGL